MTVRMLISQGILTLCHRDPLNKPLELQKEAVRTVFHLQVDMRSCQEVWDVLVSSVQWKICGMKV